MLMLSVSSVKARKWLTYGWWFCVLFCASTKAVVVSTQHLGQVSGTTVPGSYAKVSITSSLRDPTVFIADNNSTAKIPDYIVIEHATLRGIYGHGFKIATSVFHGEVSRHSTDPSDSSGWMEWELALFANGNKVASPSITEQPEGIRVEVPPGSISTEIRAIGPLVITVDAGEHGQVTTRLNVVGYADLGDPDT